jgi:putative SOS response-associated peptidase YedK
VISGASTGELFQAKLTSVCSRYARWIIFEEIEEFSELRLPPEPLPTTYNAAPQSVQPIVRLSPTGEPQIVLARWGLIPFWAKDAKIGYSTINARSEELDNKPAFRESLKSRRCLVPANCFYEWQQISPKEKQPFAIGMKDDRPFVFAGLWDRWRAPDGSLMESFTINTVAPNDLMKPLHDRMPCILAREDSLRWLDPDLSAKSALDLLQPYRAEQMRAWRVGKAVGNVRNDSAALIEEIGSEAPNGNRAMTRSLWEQN